MIRTIYFRATHLIALSVALSVFSASVFVFLLVQSSNVQKEKVFYDAAQIILAVNKKRLAQNIPELLLNNKLEKASRMKVESMVENKYFSHISPVSNVRWSSFIQNSSYPYLEAGENLANGYYSVDEIVTAWLNSPSHRANILNPNYIETGVSVQSGVLNGKPTIFVVQFFGKQDETGFIQKI